MNRELERRLAALEQRKDADRRFFTVSGDLPTDEEWEATKDGADMTIYEPAGLSPILTEADWVARHCQDSECGSGPI